MPPSPRVEAPILKNRSLLAPVKKYIRALFCSTLWGEHMKYQMYRGLELSEVGIGCYGLSGAYGSVDKEKYKDVLRYAHEVGITLFDTAETYGEDAERILGEVLKPVRERCISPPK